MAEDILIGLVGDEEEQALPAATDTDQQVLRSATLAALGGLYDYSLVPAGHEPYKGQDYRVITATEQTTFMCRSFVDSAGDPLPMPAGTVLHCYNSHTCWRVDTGVLPDGTTFCLSAT